MKNKLGLCDYKFKNAENKIVNYKLNILDETYTFNCDLFSIEYLIQLNKFLFEDIYYDSIKYIFKSDMEIDYLKYLLGILKKSAQLGDQKEVLNIVEEIWHRQPFTDGNTRTMIAYLKVIKLSFLLDIPLNVNTKIESSPKMFKLSKC